MKRTPVKELHAETIDKQAIHVDWSTIAFEYFPQGEINPADGEHEEPMMDYLYPLPNEFENDHPDIEEAAKLLDGLPLCLVRFENRLPEYGLALTGGGMDFSWEICEAHMRLGYLPPLSYTDLPAMAGFQWTPTNRWIVQGCRRTLQVLSWRIGIRRRSLQMVATALKEESARRR